VFIRSARAERNEKVPVIYAFRLLVPHKASIVLDIGLLLDFTHVAFQWLVKIFLHFAFNREKTQILRTQKEFL
jgi:hypothetical protein